MRLDSEIFRRGLAQSRTRARLLIENGDVTVNGLPARKPAAEISEEDEILVRDSIGFVSRGGLKLEKALETFGISPAGKTALDIGASTGGFTQCLLAHGAAHVFAVDVGRMQLAQSLRDDPRVTVMEETNARFLTPAMFGGRADLAVMDVSFISQTLLYPALFPCVNGPVIALLKPQFEAGRQALNKNGIVTDPDVYRIVTEKIRRSAEENGRRLTAVTESPVKGGDGNTEFLVLLEEGICRQSASM